MAKLLIASRHAFIAEARDLVLVAEELDGRGIIGNRILALLAALIGDGAQEIAIIVVGLHRDELVGELDRAEGIRDIEQQVDGAPDPFRIAAAFGREGDEAFRRLAPIALLFQSLAQLIDGLPVAALARQGAELPGDGRSLQDLVRQRNTELLGGPQGVGALIGMAHSTTEQYELQHKCNQ